MAAAAEAVAAAANAAFSMTSHKRACRNGAAAAEAVAAAAELIRLVGVRIEPMRMRQGGC